MERHVDRPLASSYFTSPACLALNASGSPADAERESVVFFSFSLSACRLPLSGPSLSAFVLSLTLSVLSLALESKGHTPIGDPLSPPPRPAFVQLQEVPKKIPEDNIQSTSVINWVVMNAAFWEFKAEQRQIKKIERKKDGRF